MKNLILLRHGQSWSNANKDLYFEKGLYDHSIELTEKGVEQAKKCGASLAKTLTGPYTVFVSPYLRAQQTWASMQPAIGLAPTKVIVDGRLREQEFKRYTNREDFLTKSDSAERRGKLYYRFKNAESGYDVLNRVGGFYNQLRMDWMLGTRDEDVLVVSHNITIRCLVMVALELGPEDFDRIWASHCDPVCLGVDGSGKTVPVRVRFRKSLEELK